MRSDRQGSLIGDVQLLSLQAIAQDKIIALMNNRAVGRLLPLLTGDFDESSCRSFLAAKQRLWDEHGYGPWAFVIDGEFAGWGGLQPEQGEADMALILDPKYWGWGRRVFERVKAHAFDEMQLESITLLFPPIRTNARAVTRFGFVEEGRLCVDGQTFIRFRLKNTSR